MLHEFVSVISLQLKPSTIGFSYIVLEQKKKKTKKNKNKNKRRNILYFITKIFKIQNVGGGGGVSTYQKKSPKQLQ